MHKIESSKSIYEVGEKVFAIDIQELNTIKDCDICGRTTKVKIQDKDLYVVCPYCNDGIIETKERNYMIVEFEIIAVDYGKRYDKNGFYEYTYYYINDNKETMKAFGHEIEDKDNGLFKTREEALTVMNDIELFNEYKTNNYTCEYLE